MEITGRIAADATVKTLNDGRQVTGFTLVQNDYFKTKSGEKKNVATFFKCAYWVSIKAIDFLKKGSIVTLYGRIGLDVYTGQNGDAKGTLTFHVNDIKFISKPATTANTTVATPAQTNTITDDLPF